MEVCNRLAKKNQSKEEHITWSVIKVIESGIVAQLVESWI